jgi:tripartite-type tricarboxylate transporter receptor subunit TctC
MKKILLGILAALFSSFAAAQAYPSKPIRIMVAFPPGGPTDIIARLVSPKMSELLGQPVVVENVTGAGGNIATGRVAKSDPDGYTILLHSSGFAVNPALSSNAGYDPQKDFLPIAVVASQPNVIIVNASFPARTLAELLQMAKTEKLAYASPSSGTTPHLTAENLFKVKAKVDITHVPFKGGGPAMTAMLGGQIHSYFATPVAAGPHVKAGKVKALATTGPKRDPFMAEVPTVAESGYPGYQATNWYGYYAPAKTPKEILERLNKEIVKALNSTEVKELLAKQGLEAAPGTPEELAKFSKAEWDTWGKVVKEAGIKAQ